MKGCWIGDSSERPSARAWEIHENRGQKGPKTKLWGMWGCFCRMPPIESHVIKMPQAQETKRRGFELRTKLNQLINRQPSTVNSHDETRRKTKDEYNYTTTQIYTPVLKAYLHTYDTLKYGD